VAGISIFMLSRITSDWSACTASPTLTSIFHTVPVTSDWTVKRAIGPLLVMQWSRFRSVNVGLLTIGQVSDAMPAIGLHHCPEEPHDAPEMPLFAWPA
jgi:hypothetical protein